MQDINISKGILFLSQNDPILEGLISKIGPCRLEPSKTYFEDIIRNIISQQLSVKVAGTIIKRFHNLVGEIKPENISKFSSSDLKEVGISGQKARYILDISNQVVVKSFSFDDLNELENSDLIDTITSLNGIGIWTAQMFLIFSLNRLDILPLNDIGFQRAVCKYYNIEKSDFYQKISIISKSWGNFKTIAVWYLWEALDTL